MCVRIIGSVKIILGSEEMIYPPLSKRRASRMSPINKKSSSEKEPHEGVHKLLLTLCP